MSARLWAGVTDLGTVPPTAARRAHGLRSESAVDGWYAAPSNPRKPRPARPKSGPVRSNRKPVDPAVARELALQEAIRLREEAEEIAREQALEERRAAWRKANVIGDMDS